MAGNTSGSTSGMVERITAVLSAFDEGHPSRTLTELARASGLALSTTHRLAAELTRHQLLERTPTGTYVIGRLVWNLGQLAPVQTDLRRVAGPFLHDLHAATLATINLAITEGQQVLYIDTLVGSRSVSVLNQVGTRLPMHATGVGKVLLAYGSDELRRAVLEAPLRRVTAHTITQPGRLLRQLEAVLHDGYATTQEEMSLGACSVAVPVRLAGASAGGTPAGPSSRPGEPGQVVAAIGAVVPNLRRERQRLITALRVCAAGIGRSLETRTAQTP